MNSGRMWKSHAAVISDESRAVDSVPSRVCTHRVDVQILSEFVMVDEDDLARRATSTLQHLKVLRRTRKGLQSRVRRCMPCSCTAYTAKKSNRVCRLCEPTGRTERHDNAVRAVLARLSHSLPNAVCVLEVELFALDDTRNVGRFAEKRACFRADVVVVCEAWACVIEVDGPEHWTKEHRQNADDDKTKLLNDLNVPVVRLPVPKDGNDASLAQAVNRAVHEVCESYRATV